MLPSVINSTLFYDASFCHEDCLTMPFYLVELVNAALKFGRGTVRVHLGLH